VPSVEDQPGLDDTSVIYKIQATNSTTYIILFIIKIVHEVQI